jgi:hypothetical protein
MIVLKNYIYLKIKSIFFKFLINLFHQFISLLLNDSDKFNFIERFKLYLRNYLEIYKICFNYNNFFL